MARALTGVQKEVLALYRQLLRTVRAKDVDAETATFSAAYIRSEFEKHRSLKKTNILLIEHFLRQGRKQLALLQQPGVKLAPLSKP